MHSESLCFPTSTNISIVRCTTVHKSEPFLLAIPTLIEVLFAMSLLIKSWGNGRRNLWITAEGWIFLSLALIEIFPHIHSVVRGLDHHIFGVLNLVLAVASFAPMICYLLFIFLLAKAELITTLPRRFQTISKLLLLFLIPIIVALNVLVSLIERGFVGKIGNTSNGSRTNGSDDKNLIWFILTSVKLALLAAYQFIGFCLAFFRLTKAILNQQRIETTASGEVQSLKGIGWITAGLQLGAVETIIGFVEAGFVCAMTRLIMRLLARAILIIGLVKGLDTSENLEEEPARSQRGSFRSSRHSARSQLSPTASVFPLPPPVEQDNPLYPTERGLLGMDTKMEELSSAGKLAQERVAIRFENGTPRLHMRFSHFEIPKFPISRSDTNLTRALTDTVQKPHTSTSRPTIFHADTSHPPSPWSALDIREPVPTSTLDVESGGTTPLKNALENLQSLAKVNRPSSKITRSESSHSSSARTRSTMDSYASLSDVRDLTSQFPALPALIEPIKRLAANAGTPGSFWDDSPAIVSRARSLVEASTLRPWDATIPDSIATTPTTILSSYMTTPAQSMSTTLTDEPYLDIVGPARSRGFGKDNFGPSVAPGNSNRDTIDWIDFDGIPAGSLPPVIEELDEEQSGAVSRHSQRSRDMGSLSMSWPENSDFEEEIQLQQAVNLRSQVARIKSIGKAPVRVTPRPVKAGYSRDSLHIEQIQVPPRGDMHNVAIVQDRLG